MKSDFDELKKLATLIVSSDNPAATGPAYTDTVPARCNAAVETNWGEPTVATDPCFNYFPIIYHYGNLKLQGGRGQGILLVEGDLTATGGMVFYGPVFVTGTLSTTGNSGQGAKFFGGVIAGNVALDDLTKLAGGALVSYSSCAVKRALAGSATPDAVRRAELGAALQLASRFGAPARGISVPRRAFGARKLSRHPSREAGHCAFGVRVASPSWR